MACTYLELPAGYILHRRDVIHLVLRDDTLFACREENIGITERQRQTHSEIACEHARRPRVPPTYEMAISRAFLTRPGAFIIRAVVILPGVLIACERNKDNLQAGHPSSCNRVPTTWYDPCTSLSEEGQLTKGLVAGLYSGMTYYNVYVRNRDIGGEMSEGSKDQKPVKTEVTPFRIRILADSCPPSPLFVMELSPLKHFRSVHRHRDTLF